ncbi:hypothetical protein BJ138DRAFT_1108043 [Hygrophoropsis aurantiaca]|uniref:Uncharacterized protein n=1 Tax=Hygrophoropsis aurantiaca TaxID=72124 RepID=A0ACB7ZPK2_9AGAM|nr:hypothetical protein BJ138DRAFT_1108043 [Hygrophoropsis aurantiaca]
MYDEDFAYSTVMRQFPKDGPEAVMLAYFIRLARYVVIWLTIRSQYLELVFQGQRTPASPTYRHTLPNGLRSPTPLPSQLNLPYLDNRVGQTNAAIAEFFGELTQKQFTLRSPVMFYEFEVKLEDLHLDERDSVWYCWLLWDLNEHSFCAKVINLDKLIMRDIPKTGWWSPRTKNLYPFDYGGFAAADWRVRLPFIEAFHDLISPWPLAPPALLAPILSDAGKDCPKWAR